MGRLDEIRDVARATIHGEFSLPATVRSPDGSVEIPALTVRLHRDLKKPFGDLDREGFALVIEQFNQVIFDREQWNPIKNWTVDFGRDRIFTLVNFVGDRADRYIKMEVTLAR